MPFIISPYLSVAHFFHFQGHIPNANEFWECFLCKICFKRKHQVRMQSWSSSNSLQTAKWRNSKCAVGSILYFQRRLDNIWIWDIKIGFEFEVKKFFRKELISSPKRSWNNGTFSLGSEGGIFHILILCKSRLFDVNTGVSHSFFYYLKRNLGGRFVIGVLQSLLN